MKSDSKEFELIKLLKNSKVSINNVASFLQSNEVNLNQLDNHGYNCLHYSIKAEKADIVNFLIIPNEKFKNADVNIETMDNSKNIYLSPILLALNSVNDSTSCYKIIRALFKVIEVIIRFRLMQT